MRNAFYLIGLMDLHTWPVRADRLQHGAGNIGGIAPFSALALAIA